MIVGEWWSRWASCSDGTTEGGCGGSDFGDGRGGSCVMIKVVLVIEVLITGGGDSGSSDASYRSDVGDGDSCSDGSGSFGDV